MVADWDARNTAREEEAREQHRLYHAKVAESVKRGYIPIPKRRGISSSSNGGGSSDGGGSSSDGGYY